jgi:hypothetical protein
MIDDERMKNKERGIKNKEKHTSKMGCDEYLQTQCKVQGFG